ncbi:MAG: glycoside hydrolase family 99-like domain-containing protein [Oscillospiraceae bacterium]|nr:glycoside hydrolase family 99-like domain-containing protein [Oscillospiraceae bacterium]MCL2278303.1 glycoside hydrolase family 99-like domain-containing protein [Oscillospiraceae bacterium]
MKKLKNLIGRLGLRLQKMTYYQDPDVLHRYRHYEDTIKGERETIARLKTSVSDSTYKALTDTFYEIGKKGEFFEEYQEHNITFTDEDVKPIAFYLPQFYTFPENDEWWGKGFTEWTNVTKAVPQFVGHYQPHLPYDSTFYDLTDISVLRRQVELAKNYGIYGFCFHYYWFGGKRLLEKPLDNFLNDKTLELPFCINYANENWSRRWDGTDDKILMKQEHSDEDDLACIADICKYIRDERYIKINGKPLIIIYNASVYPDVNKTLSLWRGYCKDNGIGEIHLVGAQTDPNRDPLSYDFDDAVEFPPHFFHMYAQKIPLEEILQVESKDGYHVFNMEDYIKNKRHHNNEPERIYKTVFPGWDNSARRGESGVVYPMTPRLYKKWLLDVMKYTAEKREPGERLVFVNAWNEWAEGAHLEPDRRNGYAYLEATADSIFEARKFLP